MHRRDPRVKVVVFVAVTVAAVAFARPSVYLACAILLAGVAAVARVGPGALWRRARMVLPLVLAAGLFVPLLRTGGREWAVGPFTVHEHGLAVFGNLAAKASIGTFSAVLLSATTTFPSVLHALEALRVPRLFVLIAGMMYRYLFVISDELGRMRAALVARGYSPRHALHTGPIGRVATALFLRSHARGERVHLAMLSRGFTGSVPTIGAPPATAAMWRAGLVPAVCAVGICVTVWVLR